MAFGGFDNNRQGAPMADINVTPMVDVMLVLLVIFIITAPLFTHAVKLDLPAAQSAPAPEKPETVTLSIDPAGAIFWNDAPVSQADLPARMAAAAQKHPRLSDGEAGEQNVRRNPQPLKRGAFSNTLEEDRPFHGCASAPGKISLRLVRPAWPKIFRWRASKP